MMIVLRDTCLGNESPFDFFAYSLACLKSSSLFTLVSWDLFLVLQFKLYTSDIGIYIRLLNFIC